MLTIFSLCCTYLLSCFFTSGVLSGCWPSSFVQYPARWRSQPYAGSTGVAVTRWGTLSFQLVLVLTELFPQRHYFSITSLATQAVSSVKRVSRSCCVMGLHCYLITWQHTECFPVWSTVSIIPPLWKKKTNMVSVRLSPFHRIVQRPTIFLLAQSPNVGTLLPAQSSFLPLTLCDIIFFKCNCGVFNMSSGCQSFT